MSKAFPYGRFEVTLYGRFWVTPEGRNETLKAKFKGDPSHSIREKAKRTLDEVAGDTRFMRRTRKRIHM